MSADDLCTYCRGRVAAFAHDHHSEAEVAERIDQLVMACCSHWKGHEPSHWFGRLVEEPSE